MTAAKPFTIPKRLVYEALEAVKANAGSAGVDNETIEDFETDLKDNLYRIWNRMSSGSYFPPPVKAVAIPKKTGGERILGVPTVADRVAQMVVKQVLEPNLEPIFLPDSYGYRPEKSALDAIAVTRERCWRYDWVLEFDIKGLFDNIDHTLLLRALEKHTECKWVKLYIERWLTAPLQLSDGTMVERTKGTPQGGVVSPVLANLFLHYAFDAWMARTFPGVPWCRYADDGLVHCKTEAQAQAIKAALPTARGVRPGNASREDADCLLQGRESQGEISEYEVRLPRVYLQAADREERKRNSLFVGFTPAVSAKALKAMRANVRRLNYRNRTDLSLQDISRLYNPVLRGWMAYYGRFYPSAMYPIFRHFNKTLVAWAMRKFKRLRGPRRGQPAPRKYRGEAAPSFRTLAARNRGRVCLMGAV